MALKISVEDRVSTYPGRVVMTPVYGSENTYDMVRADSPITEGTPINKELLDNKAYTLTSDVRVYVSTVGSDIDGDGSQDLPFKTIQKAIDELPKCLGGFTATIDVAAGTYEERITATGFFGGKLIIGVIGKNATLRGMIINACSNVELNIRYITRSASLDGRLLYVDGGSNVNITNNLTIDCGQTTEAGITAINNSRVSAGLNVSVSVSNGGESVIVATHGSKIALNTLTGTGNLFGLYATYGSEISYTSSTMESALGDAVYGGSSIISGNGASTLFNADVV